MKQYNNPLTRLIKGTRYSLEGIYYALKHEQSFQYEAIIFVALCIFLCLVELNLEHKIFLVIMWLIVMAFEIVNSAVEEAFDLIDENFRPKIKAGKDMLSGAVFLMISVNVMLWLAEIINALVLS